MKIPPLLAESPSNLAWLAEILELRIMLIIWVPYKSKRVWKPFGVFHNSTSKCFSIIIYLLVYLYNSHEVKLWLSLEAIRPVEYTDRILLWEQPSCHVRETTTTYKSWINDIWIQRYMCKLCRYFDYVL